MYGKDLPSSIRDSKLHLSIVEVWIAVTVDCSDNVMVPVVV